MDFQFTKKLSLASLLYYFCLRISRPYKVYSFFYFLRDFYPRVVSWNWIVIHPITRVLCESLL